MKSKSDKNKANKLIISGLLEMGAKQVPDPNFSVFSIKTKYGELKVTIAEPISRSIVMACYSKFTDIDKAKDFVDCNPYSGKWNWTVFAIDYEIEAFANKVLSDIKAIL
jgi:hypothetical protein